MENDWIALFQMLGYNGIVYCYLPSHVKNGLVILLCIFERTIILISCEINANKSMIVPDLNERWSDSQIRVWSIGTSSWEALYINRKYNLKENTCTMLVFDIKFIRSDKKTLENSWTIPRFVVKNIYMVHVFIYPAVPMPHNRKGIYHLICWRQHHNFKDPIVKSVVFYSSFKAVHLYNRL